MRILTIISLILLITGCTQPIKQQSTYKQSTYSDNKIQPLFTLYDFQIIDSVTEKLLSVKELAAKVQDADVIFIGEYHGNHASHLLQAQLQSELFKLNPKQILTLEQFTTEKQHILDAYLDGKIGEKTLIKQANAWSNYKASYRPLIEFAKRNLLPVYAANAPAGHVRCVAREGKQYLDRFKDNKYLPQQPFLSNKYYEEKFMNIMQELKGNRDHKNSFYAQLLRDNSMAEIIIKALNAHPNYQLIHLNGAFHSNNFLGTVALLKQRNPALNIKVISPVRVEDIKQPSYTKVDLAKGNFIYLITPQPVKYKKAENRKAAFKKMFQKSREKVCK